MIRNARLIHDTRGWHDNRPARGRIDRPMSQTDLRQIISNPHKWRYGEDAEETDCMNWGKLIDALAMPTPNSVLRVEPKTYKAISKKGEVTEKPWHNGADACKQWHAEQPNGALIVSSNDYEAAKVAVDRLLSDSTCGLLFRESRFQVGLAAEWHDQDTGLVVGLRGLVDLAPNAGTTYDDCLADLKTTESIDEHAWTRKVYSKRYDIQAALYLDMWNAATGECRDTFRHAVQESEAPFEVAPRQLSEENLRMGRDGYRQGMRQYCRYLKADTWPTLDDMIGKQAGKQVRGWTIVDPPKYAVESEASKIEWPQV